MTLSAETLAADPKFLSAVQFLARRLRGAFEGNPRLSRFFSSHQRWLLSQAAFALHLEYDPERGVEGLTTARLKDMIKSINAASRNTVLTFLDQLIAYRYARVVGDPTKRPRRFEATEVSGAAMVDWLAANLAALDLVDGGSRHATLAARPEIFGPMHSKIARRCLEDPRWREPPDRVAMFLWTEAGGVVMDDFMCRINVAHADAETLDLGRIEARTMAETFLMSRTHLQRLLRKAVEAGCLSWNDERKTSMSMKRDYLQEYLGWQAVKFAIVARTFDEVAGPVMQNGGEAPDAVARVKDAG